jgi:hypothetical protein
LRAAFVALETTNPDTLTHIIHAFAHKQLLISIHSVLIPSKTSSLTIVTDDKNYCLDVLSSLKKLAADGLFLNSLTDVADGGKDDTDEGGGVSGGVGATPMAAAPRKEYLKSIPKHYGIHSFFDR